VSSATKPRRRVRTSLQGIELGAASVALCLPLTSRNGPHGATALIGPSAGHPAGKSTGRPTGEPRREMR
jgi:hypothetical protein